MRVSIRKLAVLGSLLLTLGGFSSYAMAQVNFSDDFESYDLYVGPGFQGLIGGDWLVYANVFSGYSSPCGGDWWYGYGADAPNTDLGFSNISTGKTGQALNVFSDYNNANHGDGACIETSVFQEITFSAADAGSYTFMFVTETPDALGAGVDTFGFVKFLDPDNGWSLIGDPELVSTVTAGTKSITVTLDASLDGKIVQWGFSTIASNYEPSGRYYDSVSFAPEGSVTPPGGPDFDGIPIPKWALFAMALLLLYVGGKRLQSRRLS